MARNSFDIAKLAKAKGRRVNAKWRPPKVPPVYIKQLFNIHNKVVRFWAGFSVTELLPAYSSAMQQLAMRDGADDIIRAIIRAAQERADRMVAELEEDLSGWAVGVEEWERGQFIRGLRGSVGVDTSPFLNREDAAEEIAAYVDKNVALIKGLNGDLAKDVERTVWDGFIKQQPRQQMAKELSERMGVGRSRAELIARDQTTKLGNDMNRIRQEQAGITQYIWRHSGKVNFREEHKDRDGQIFEWDSPPDDGHPGEAINCGCTAEAYIEI